MDELDTHEYPDSQKWIPVPSEKLELTSLLKDTIDTTVCNKGYATQEAPLCIQLKGAT